MDRELLEMASFIQGIVSVVMIIVFFVMSSNVSKIKKKLGGSTDPKALEEEAQLQLFCGNTDKAVELYHLAAHYLVKKEGFEYTKKVLKISNKISNIGGVVSPELLKYVEKNCK